MGIPGQSFVRWDKINKKIEDTEIQDFLKMRIPIVVKWGGKKPQSQM